MTATKKNIVEALIGFHQDVKPIHRESMAQYGKYADLQTVLSEIKPALIKHGLIITQEFRDGGLATMLRHTGGETFESFCMLIESGGRNPLHTWGAAVTYQRRYAILSLLGLATEDDDGDTAGHKMKPVNATSSDDFL